MGVWKTRKAESGKVTGIRKRTGTRTVIRRRIAIGTDKRVRRETLYTSTNFNFSIFLTFLT